MLADCVTLWIGDALGPVERACLQSVLRQGHSLALYCYDTPGGVPGGVEIRDAAEILHLSKVFVHHSGSMGPFADWFRYELQKRGAGTWVDTDMYLIRPLDLERPHLFGEESPGMINNAVLRLPPDSPMLPLLLEPFEQRRTPDWLDWRLRLPMLVRQVIKGELDLSRVPWGSTGPLAVNAIARRLGLSSEALPPDVLYPVAWQDADWIRDSARALEDMVTPRTVAIHLWNECIRRYKNAPAPDGSFLQRLQDEGGA